RMATVDDSTLEGPPEPGNIDLVLMDVANLERKSTGALPQGRAQLDRRQREPERAEKLGSQPRFHRARSYAGELRACRTRDRREVGQFVTGEQCSEVAEYLGALVTAGGRLQRLDSGPRRANDVGAVQLPDQSREWIRAMAIPETHEILRC